MVNSIPILKPTTMDKEAQQFAINFAEWIGINYDRDNGSVVGNVYYEIGEENSKDYSIPELLEVYMDEIQDEGYIINFDSFLKQGERILVKKDIGEYYKRISNINTIFDSLDRITFVISEKILSINPSFLEGYFGDIIEANGKESFYNKIKFRCEGKFNIEGNLYDTIYRVLRRTNN